MARESCPTVRLRKQGPMTGQTAPGGDFPATGRTLAPWRGTAGLRSNNVQSFACVIALRNYPLPMAGML